MSSLRLSPRGIDSDALIVTLGVDEAVKWEDHASFKDIGSASFDVSGIAAELTGKDVKAPITLTLQTRPDVPPGNHSLQFFFTYFNGNAWKTDVRTASITVPNWFRRNEGVTWTIGILAAVTALGSLALNTADKWRLIQPILGPLVEVQILAAGVVILLCIAALLGVSFSIGLPLIRLVRKPLPHTNSPMTLQMRWPADGAKDSATGLLLPARSTGTILLPRPPAPDYSHLPFVAGPVS